MISLERTNITARYLSWKRAVSTGNWGTDPTMQRTLENQSFVGYRNPGAANTTSFEEFSRVHAEWYKTVSRLQQRTNGPIIRLRAENLMSGEKGRQKTFSRVVAFLTRPSAQ